MVKRSSYRIHIVLPSKADTETPSVSEFPHACRLSRYLPIEFSRFSGSFVQLFAEKGIHEFVLAYDVDVRDFKQLFVVYGFIPFEIRVAKRISEQYGLTM